MCVLVYVGMCVWCVCIDFVSRWVWKFSFVCIKMIDGASA